MNRVRIRIPLIINVAKNKTKSGELWGKNCDNPNDWIVGTRLISDWSVVTASLEKRIRSITFKNILIHLYSVEII